MDLLKGLKNAKLSTGEPQTDEVTHGTNYQVVKRTDLTKDRLKTYIHDTVTTRGKKFPHLSNCIRHDPLHFLPHPIIQRPGVSAAEKRRH